MCLSRIAKVLKTRHSLTFLLWGEVKRFMLWFFLICMEVCSLDMRQWLEVLILNGYVAEKEPVDRIARSSQRRGRIGSCHNVIAEERHGTWRHGRQYQERLLCGRQVVEGHSQEVCGVLRVPNKQIRKEKANLSVALR